MKLLRRLLWIGIRVLAVIAVLLVVAWFLRGPLFGGLVRDALTDQLAQALGGRYRIQDVRGTWLGDVEIVGLETVEPSSAGVVTNLSAERLVVTFDLLGLLGEDPLGAIESIRLAKGRVDLDLRRDPPDDGEPSTPVFDVLPRRLPDLDAGLDVRVTLAEGSVDVSDLVLACDDGRAIRLAARQITVPERFGDGGPLAATVTWIPRLRLVWRSATPLSGVVLATAYYERGDRIEAHLEVAGGEVLAIQGGDGLAVRARRLDWARVPPFARALAEAAVPLPDRGTFDLHGSARSGTPLAATLSLKGDGWGWGERTFERVVLDATHDAQATRISRLSARGEAGTVEALDIRLEPDRPYLVGRVGALQVEVPELRTLVDGIDRPLAVSIDARTDDAEVLHVRRLDVRSGSSRLEAHGRATLPVEPDRWRETAIEMELEARLDGVRVGTLDARGRVEVRGRAGGTLAAPSGRVAVAGRDLVVDGRAVARLDANAVLDWPRLELTGLDVAAAFGRIAGEAALAFEPFAVDRARLDLDVSDIAGCVALVPGEMPALSGSVSGTVRGSFAAETPAGSAALEVRDLVVDGTRIGHARVDAVADGARIHAREVVAETPWGPATLAATVDLDADSARVERLDATMVGQAVRTHAPFDVVWADPDVAINDLDLAAWGGRLTGRLRVGEELGGEVTLTNVALGAVELPLDLGGRISGHVHKTPGRLRVELESADLAYAGTTGRLRLALRQDDGPLVLKALEVDAGSALTLSASGTLPYRLVDTDLVALTDVPADMHVRGTFDRLERLEGLDIRGLAFEVRGRGEALTGAVTVADLRVHGNETLRGSARLDLAFDPRGTSARLALTPPHGARVEGTATATRILHWTDPQGWTAFADRIDDMPVSGDVRVTVPDLAPWASFVPYVSGLAGRLDVHVHAEGPLRDPHIRGTTVVDGAQGTFDEGWPALRGGSLRADADGRTLRVEALRGRLGGAPFEVAGAVVFDERLSRLVEGATVDARARASIPDLEVLSAHLPTLRFLEGRAAVDLRLTGRLLDPDVEGTLALDDLQGKVTAELPAITGGAARLRLTNRTVTVERFTGELAYSPFSVAGTVALPRDGPAEVDLKLTGSNLMIVRNRDLRVRADADLAIAGPLDALQTRGRLQITNALYTESMNLFSGGRAGADPRLQLFSVREGPLATMRFDVAIEAPDTICVRNNVIRGSFSASLRLGGDGRVPEPTGRIWFRETLVKLPYSSLKVDQGELRFPPDDPFRPSLQASARTRMKGYDLTVSLTGQLPDVAVQVSSVPALSQEDALLLVTTGATRTQLQEEGLERAALTRVGSFFGKRLLSKAGGPSDPDERSFFDRFTFELGRDVSRSGRDTVDADFELTQRWYLRAQRDRYDELNAGIVWKVRFR